MNLCRFNNLVMQTVHKACTHAVDLASTTNEILRSIKTEEDILATSLYWTFKNQDDLGLGHICHSGLGVSKIYGH